MAGQIATLTQLDFSRGENTVASPYVLRPESAQQIINMILDEHGSVRTRDGSQAVTTISPRQDRPVVKLYDLLRVSGALKKLAILKGTFGPNSLYVRSTTPWTFVSDFANSYDTPDIVTFADMAAIAAGNGEPIKSYDGTTVQAMTGAPNANHIAQHLGYLWAWNTSLTTSASAGPSSLQSSDLNNPNSWPSANQIFISKDDGQSGTSLALFTIAESGISPTATIIAWKDFSGYECSGVLGSTSFTVQKIKSDMGCVAPRSIQFISGFGLIRLTHRGFSLYDGVNDTLISEEERPRIFGRDAYVGLDWANINKSMSCQVSNPPLYICACPVAGGNGSLQRVFLFDLVRRAWTVATFPHDMSTMQLILTPGQLPQVLAGDFKDGYVRRIFAGDPDDDGQPVNWSIISRAYVAGSPFSRAYWRRLLVQAYGFAVNTVLSATFQMGPTTPYSAMTKTATVPAVSVMPITPGYGSAPWGSSPWGAQTPVGLSSVNLEFPIGQIANDITVTLSGSGPGKIRGWELHTRQKAHTRATYAKV